MCVTFNLGPKHFLHREWGGSNGGGGGCSSGAKARCVFKTTKPIKQNSCLELCLQGSPVKVGSFQW